MRYLIIILVLFASCKTTEWQSKKRLMKVELHHPQMLAAYCGEKYPIIENVKVIKGDSVIVTDTLLVDCGDSLVMVSVNKIVKVPYIKTIHRTDTVLITAKSTSDLDAEKGRHEITQTQRDKVMGGLATWRIIALIAIGLFIISLIVIVLILKRKATII